MLVATEHRETLSLYCMIRKVTQEVAVNEMIGEALTRLDADPLMKERLEKARTLEEMMAKL